MVSGSVFDHTQLVSGGTFGQLWSAPVEGQVYAQPLLADGTLIVATEDDKVYGLGPATGALKWSKPLSLGTPWNPVEIGCSRSPLRSPRPVPDRSVRR